MSPGANPAKRQRSGCGVWPGLFGSGDGGTPAVICDPVPHFSVAPATPEDTARALTAAFLVRLAGAAHPLAAPAEGLLRRLASDPGWGTAAALFRDALDLVPDDVDRAAASDPAFAARLRELEAVLPAEYSPAVQELLWSVFFPEGTGLRGRREERTADLRRRRLVRITALNPSPLAAPVREILFTANALFAPPPDDADIDALPLEPAVRRELARVMAGPQVHWYDHPVRVGTAPAHNEVLYGLRHLDEALAWEIRRGNAPPGARAACVLSVSVTHRGLSPIARSWLEGELARAGGLRHLDLHVFTEPDAARLVEKALVPLSGRRGDDADALREVFGVDGPYGRHYSFLKAVAALWQAVVDPAVRAVFKIDLDQVFPQPELEREAGASMAGLFRTPLWGAHGTDADGAPVELGMIAGALVDERDIRRGLFTPDVAWPDAEPAAPGRLFWSRLPQALSTEAEMTARYGAPPIDGRTACLQRVHVTGGTNGILIDALRRHRPFTPSFIGRAEDQAYLMSAAADVAASAGTDAGGRGGRCRPRLAYAHRPGLVMRHDKEAFAGDAVRAARVGKAVGDILRVLQFSAYARALGGTAALKERFDPFTGCFMSRIPRAVSLLRFALEAVAEFEAGRPAAGLEFVRDGAPRLRRELDFTDPATGGLERRLARERDGWTAYFESVDAASAGAAAGAMAARGGAGSGVGAEAARAAAVDIIRGCRVRL